MALSLLDAHLAKCAPPVAECLNARYQRGTPTADPEAAGVFITQFDKAHAGTRPWMPCDRAECMHLSDRFEGTCINHGWSAGIWSTTLPGMVISSEAVHRRSGDAELLLALLGLQGGPWQRITIGLAESHAPQDPSMLQLRHV